MSSELMRTVFTRSFDKHIILSYLHSGSPSKENAALLSIGNSSDSIFLESVLSLKTESPLQYFAIGKLGASDRARKFLRERLSNPEKDEPLLQELIAFGRCGSKEDVFFLMDMFRRNKQPIQNGFSLALYEFWQREIRPPELRQMLRQIIIDRQKDAELLTQTFFALARIGPEAADADALLQFVAAAVPENLNPPLRQQFLTCVRRMKNCEPFLPYLRKFFAAGSLIEKVEIARIIGNAGLRDSVSFQNANNLLSDPSVNVRIQMAQSLRGSEVSKPFLSPITEMLSHAIRKKSAGGLEQSEFCAALLKFAPDQKETVKPFIPDEYYFETCTALPDIFTEEILDIESGFGILSSELQFRAFRALLGLKNDARFTGVIDRLAEGLLQKDEPYILSLLLENADSVFCLRNEQILTARLPEIIQRASGNAAYADAMQAIQSLPDHIRQKLKLPFSQAQSALSDARNALQNDILSKAFSAKYAVVITSKGSLTIELNPAYAPVSCGNFIALARKGFFNGVRFHRVVPGFVIQTGDPTGTGSGGPGHEIISELSPLHYARGVVGMARSGYDTEGSQWFVTTGDYPHLDSKYTVFGKVISGIEIADEITQDDTILSVEIR